MIWDTRITVDEGPSDISYEVDVIKLTTAPRNNMYSIGVTKIDQSGNRIGEEFVITHSFNENITTNLSHCERSVANSPKSRFIKTYLQNAHAIPIPNQSSKANHHQQSQTLEST